MCARAPLRHVARNFCSLASTESTYICAASSSCSRGRGVARWSIPGPRHRQGGNQESRPRHEEPVGRPTVRVGLFICRDARIDRAKGGREEGGPRRVRETKYTGWSELSLRQAATSFTPIQPPRSLRARVFRFTSNLRPTSSRRSRPGVLYPFLASPDRRPKVSKPVVPPKSVKSARAGSIRIVAENHRDRNSAAVNHEIQRHFHRRARVASANLSPPSTSITQDRGEIIGEKKRERPRPLGPSS